MKIYLECYGCHAVSWREAIPAHCQHCHSTNFICRDIWGQVADVQPLALPTIS